MSAYLTCKCYHCRTHPHWKPAETETVTVTIDRATMERVRDRLSENEGQTLDCYIESMMIGDNW